QQQNVHGGVGAHARLLADHFINELQVVAVRTDRTADHAVGVAQPHHHGTDQGQATAHFHACHFLGDAAATHQLPVGGPVAVEALIVVGVGDFVVLVETQAQTEFLDAVGDHGRAADQNRTCQAFIDDDLHRTQHTFVFALGEHDAALAPAARPPVHPRAPRLP